MSQRPGIIEWPTFEQPHRRTRDYNGLGPFTFDERAYESALHDLDHLVAAFD